MRIHPSVRQWVLSFLAVDGLFFLLSVGSCLWRPVDCLEVFTFGPFFFYLPTALLLDALYLAIQPLAALPFWGTITLFLIFGILSHALLGAIIGWLLRNRKVGPVVSFVAAIVALALLTFGFAKQQEREEAARETYVSLWAVEDVSETMISTHDATILGAQSPSTFELVVDEGTTTWNLENTSRTEVWLICNAASCDDEAVDGKVRLTFREYVAAHDAC